jgi:hypothetical protein
MPIAPALTIGGYDAKPFLVRNGKHAYLLGHAPGQPPVAAIHYSSS